MDTNPVDPMKEKVKPVSRVSVPEEAGKGLKIGGDISVEVSGKIKAVHHMGDSYEVEIEDPMVEIEGSNDEANEDDENPATMPREKLKKKITKDEEY
jgi:hypothetical protein